MYLNSFKLINFLSFDTLEINFEKFTTIDNLEALKGFYIIKLFIALSEDHPEIIALIDNEKRPNKSKEMKFEILLNIHSYLYQYKIIIFNKQIVYEELFEISSEKKCIYQRIANELVFEDEPLSWNCPNSSSKTFLNTCASKNNLHGQNFYFFFKENILGDASWIKNSLNDYIIQLFKQENLQDNILTLLKDIPIINSEKNETKIFQFCDNVQELNLLLPSKMKFQNIWDLNTRNFLKVLIYLNWLEIIGGGIFILDNPEILTYLSYWRDCSNYYQDIQFLIVKK